MFVGDPLRRPSDWRRANAEKVNSQLLRVVEGLITELGGPAVQGGPVWSIGYQEPENDRVIMDWVLLGEKGRPLARVLAAWGDPDPIRTTLRARVTIERYRKPEGGENDGPAN